MTAFDHVCARLYGKHVCKVRQGASYTIGIESSKAYFNHQAFRNSDGYRGAASCGR